MFPVPARVFPPPGVVATGWDELRPFFDELQARELPDVAALEQWLLDRSGLSALIAAEAIKREVAMTRDTESEEVRRRHLDFQSETLPPCKQAEDRLDRRLLGHKSADELDPSRWRVYLREVENAASLFRSENVPLETAEKGMQSDYGSIAGGMTLEWDGEERTLPAMRRYGLDPDPSVREAAWRAVAQRRLVDADRLDELFTQMVANRTEQGRNAGFDDYRDYCHLSWGRLDYEPSDCLAFHRAVEEHCVPFAVELREARRARMNLPTVRPWDQDCDPDGAPPFEPFQTTQEQIDLACTVFEEVDPRFADQFRFLAASDLLDLDTRRGKMPGGYMEFFEDSRLPFIFSNSGTTHDDLQTLLHEGGHAFHALASRDLEPLSYRHPPLEFAEVASMGMELIAQPFLSSIYPKEEAGRVRREHLEGVVAGLCWIATIDSFQHWLYTHPAHSSEERARAWIDLRDRFSPDFDWSDLAQEKRTEWQRQLHLFEVPFYYIEYGIAQIGALALWRDFREEPGRTLDRYREALSLGGSRPLPELFAAAGLQFDPRGEQLADLMDLIRTGLAEL